MPRTLPCLFLLLSLGCASEAGTDAGPPAVDAGAPDAGRPDAGPPPPLEVTTTAFDDGGAVPTRYQCGPPLVAAGAGENVTPAMSWTGGGDAVRSWAIVVRDRSAGDLVHWAIYDIPASVRALDAGIAEGYEPTAPAGAKQAEIQGSRYFGYFGPCSGGRGNTYEFTLHALDVEALPGVDRSTPETEVAAQVEATSIESTSFTGIW